MMIDTTRRCVAALLLLLSTSMSIGQAAEQDVAPSDPVVQLDTVLQQAEQQRIAAIEKAMPSAVSIFVPGGGGGGSGVVISPDGFALTNFHVSSPAGAHMRCGMSDGNIYDAVIVGIDPVGDLALIRLLGRDDFPFAELADSRAAEVGDWCMAIGNPFLLASNLQPSVSFGVISGVGRYQYPSGTLLEYGNCLQTDAAINPGNSGGPLYNTDSQVLGIIGRASFEKRGRVNVGVGYAISANQARNFLGYLHSGRIVDHATLGATVGTDPDGSVTVTNILELSDAYRRGLRYGDEILEIDGHSVQTANDVQNVLATLPSGWRVELVFRHEGETIRTLVRLMGVHHRDELLTKMAAALPPPPPRPEPEPAQPEPKQLNEADPPEDLPADELLPSHGEREDELQLARGGDDAEHPAVVAAMYEAKRGYANYHFNVLHQQRFIDSLRAQFPGGSRDEETVWEISGRTADDAAQRVRIRLSDEGSVAVIGDSTIEADSKGDLYEIVDAKSPAGLLPALDAWRRMITTGPEKFGETYYQGTMPLGGQRPLRHCMIGLDGEMEVRWLSHPQSRAVEAVEVVADRDDDPAELWVFRDPANSDPSAMPQRIELRYGLETVLQIQIDSWETRPANETRPASETRPAGEVQPADDVQAGDDVQAANQDADSQQSTDIQEVTR